MIYICECQPPFEKGVHAILETNYGGNNSCPSTIEVHCIFTKDGVALRRQRDTYREAYLQFAYRNHYIDDKRCTPGSTSDEKP